MEDEIPRTSRRTFNEQARFNMLKMEPVYDQSVARLHLKPRTEHVLIRSGLTKVDQVVAVVDILDQVSTLIKSEEPAQVAAAISAYHLEWPKELEPIITERLSQITHFRSLPLSAQTRIELVKKGITNKAMYEALSPDQLAKLNLSATAQTELAKLEG